MSGACEHVTQANDATALSGQRLRWRFRRIVICVAIVAAGALLIAGAAFTRWYVHITAPPHRIDARAAGPIPAINGARMAAEWEPATGVLIAWPLRLPRDLTVALASDVKLYITVRDEADRDEAARILHEWGVADDRRAFIITPQGDGWYGTRDWAAFAVFDASGQCHLVDGRYIDYPASEPDPDASLYWLSKLENLDFQPDDRAPAAVARALGLPRIELPIALTGGAVDTDGLGAAIIAEAVLRENEALGVSSEQFLSICRSALGIDRVIVVPNYEDLGVHHVDCLLKFLDAERILVKRPPRDHSQFERVERVVKVLAQHTSASGRQYEIVRIDAPRYSGEDLANYTNSLILNQRVYVPLFGIEADEQALATWREAMPGYEVLGFEYGGPDGWTYTDALHCRTKAIWQTASLPRE